VEVSCVCVMAVDMPAASLGTYLRWTTGRSLYVTLDDSMLSTKLFGQLTA